MSCGHRAINIAAQLLLEVLWTLLDLSPSGSVPHLRKRALYSSHVYVSHSSVSLSFFSHIPPFFFLSPTRSLPLSHHIHTDRVNKFLLFHPTVSHFHYKTEWIWTAAWITSPHLAFIHFPEGSQRASFFLSAAVIV